MILIHKTKGRKKEIYTIVYTLNKIRNKVLTNLTLKCKIKVILECKNTSKLG